MAQDYYKLFEVDTSVDNIKTLREEIKLLKKELESLTIGSKEYEEVSDQLYAKQTRLNEVIRDTKRPVEDADESFNSWLKTLKELKDQWKATGDAMERAKLGAQINDVKAKINAANESIGNFQHNVGNYTNSIVDAFNKMGISVGSLTAPLKKMGADIGGIDATLKLLMGSFRLFSTQTITAVVQGFKSATAGVQGFIAGLNGIKAAILATGLGALAVALGTLTAYWDDISEAIWGTSQQMKDMDYRLKQLDSSMSSMTLVCQEQVIALQAQGASTKEVLETQLFWTEIMREDVGKELNNLYKLIVETTLSTDDLTEALKRYEDVEKQVDKLLDEERILKAKIAAQDVIEQRKKEEEATRKAAEAAREAAAAAKRKADEEKRAADEAERFNAALEAGMQAAGDAAVAENEAEINKLVQERNTEYEKALQLQEEEIKKRMTAGQLEMLEYETKLELFKEYNLDTYELTKNHEEAMAKIKDDIRKEQDEKDEKQREKYKALMKARETATKNMASGTSSILKNLSTAFGESTKLGKGFAIAAATIDTIAAAVTGFRAGMNQWADAGPMAWMAPVQAALNATMALTAGFAQVQKIRSVDTSGSDTGGGGATALAIPNIEGLSTPMDYTRQVVTDTEKEEMNQSQRVYILESDIQQSNNRVRVREEETTF